MDGSEDKRVRRTEPPPEPPWLRLITDIGRAWDVIFPRLAAAVALGVAVYLARQPQALASPASLGTIASIFLALAGIGIAVKGRDKP